MSDTPERLSPDFLWGVATSAYQIEGAVNEDGRGPSIWDTYCHTPGRIANGEDADVACDHYHRWNEDLDLMKALGVDAYRFSIAWPRVLPEGRGRVEQRGLDFYDRLVDGLLARGIRPFVTLYHWDLPQALEDEGGWTNRDTALHFVEYANIVSERLGERVESWATFNEPWCSAHLGYTTGEHAPGHRSRKMGLQASHHLLLAHGLALPVMRANAPGSDHGIVLNLTPAYPASDSEEDRAAAHRFDGFFNRWYLDPLIRGRYPEDVWQGYGADAPVVEEGDLQAISAPMDFLGVNYYSRAVLEAGEGDWPAVQGVAPSGPLTEMGWEVYPQALTELLLRLANEYRATAIYITENGAAYPDRLEGGRVEDQDRIAYLDGHIRAVAEAVERGVPVKGYFAWSFMDNFEWARGYEKRFGLFHVDYRSQKRTPKASARWYSDLMASARTPSLTP